MRYRIVYLADNGSTVYAVIEKNTISRKDLETIKAFVKLYSTRIVKIYTIMV